MKKRVTLSTILPAIVAIAGLALAQTGPAEKPAAQPAPQEKPAQPAPQKIAKAKTLTAVVVSVDEQSKTVTVKSVGKKAEQHTFALEEKAAAKLAGLKAGDTVRLSYTEAEGKLTAKSIRVLKKTKPSA